jgi:cytoskeleton protein RodZ
MEPIGDYLKREREFRNIALEEISRTTKIRPSILRAIEESRLDSLGSLVFVKGYLKAYARHVGLDPTDVVLRYEASQREEEDLRSKESLDERTAQRHVKYILPATLLLLGGLFLYQLRQEPHTGKTEIVSELAHPTLPEPTQPVERAPSVASLRGEVTAPSYRLPIDIPVSSSPTHPSPPVTPPSSSGIKLRLRALDDTWIQIQIDQDPAKEILLKSGETLTRQGEERIEMKIGNAGGLELSWNDRDLGKLGESGKVVYLSVTPEEVKVQRHGPLPPESP